MLPETLAPRSSSTDVTLSYCATLAKNKVEECARLGFNLSLVDVFFDRMMLKNGHIRPSCTKHLRMCELVACELCCVSAADEEIKQRTTPHKLPVPLLPSNKSGIHIWESLRLQYLGQC